MAEINKIQGDLQFLDDTVYIKQDASNNLSFTDSVTGTKTLAELVAGASVWTQDGNDIYYNTGNVGINNSSPSAPLSLSATVVAQKFLLYDTTLIKYGQGILDNEYRNFYPSGSGFWSLGTMDTSDGTTFVEKFRVTADGEVGIGTSDPDGLVDVTSTGTPEVYIQCSSLSGYDSILHMRGARTNSVTDLIGKISFETNDSSAAGDIMAYVGAVKETAGTNVSALVFHTTSSDGGTPAERMRIANDGDVGIGTSPQEKLHTEGNIRGHNIYAYAANSTSVRVGAMVSYYSATSASEYAAFGNTQSEVYLRIYSDGHSTLNGELTAVDFLLSSDRRLKTEIDYKLEGISVDGLKPTSFRINGKFKYGFIAQDMLLTHPELVNGTGVEKEDGEIDYYSIKENSILPIVVKELQELKKEISILRNRLDQ